MQCFTAVYLSIAKKAIVVNESKYVHNNTVIAHKLKLPVIPGVS